MAQEKRARNNRNWVLTIILVLTGIVVIQNAMVSKVSLAAPVSENSQPVYDISPPNLAAPFADVKTAVVSIAVRKKISQTTSYRKMPGFNSPNQNWLFKSFATPNAPTLQPHQTQEQGFRIIVTNFHVIEDRMLSWSR